MNGMNKFKPCSRHGRRWMLHLLLAALLLVGSSVPCFGQAAGGDLETRVKAAYIYNFTKFVYWNRNADDDPTGPITIIVLGTDDIGGMLDNFSKKQTSGRPIIVKKISAGTDDFPSCHLFFIGRSARQQLPSILKQLQGTNILTVSDIPEFALQGGMIGFVIEDGRVKTQVNLRAARNAGLTISAKLLEIAKIVSSED